MSEPKATADLMMNARQQESLHGVVRAALAEDVRIERLERLKGGYSREIWSFDAVTASRCHPLVLCKDGDVSAVEAGEESLSRVEEAALLRGLHGSGIPVPGILCAGDADDGLGGAYLIMSRIEGATDVAPLLRDPTFIGREVEFSGQIARVLAAIQDCPLPPALLGKHPRDGRPLAAIELERWRRACSTIPGAMTPVMQGALDRLSAWIPPDPQNLVVCHGDFRVGNLVYGPEGLRAVLDWEMAHAGDPLEDVAWAQLVTWTGRVGGLVESPRWLDLYACETGTVVDGDRLAFWYLLGNVKMSCLAGRAATRVRDRHRKRFLDHLVGMLGRELERLL
jgi:aminoglycoside phosphotransferase (APT) family kinase protein